ncbi:MAG: alpha-ribazole phosphatase [Leptonema illini]|uniref:Alpha-ribazole phosphatase n=1 Tax=Leptonema illini TaxID=183 RepID=A0A833H3B2_9LEPT|nr:MAG: alpha-ribazole phosphatase [Leptonema illini]
MNQIWVRHGATELESGRVCGQIDPAPLLLPEECRHLESVIAGHFGEHFQQTVAFCSPLQRCSQLARRLGFSRAHSDDRLKELSFGDWEGQRWDDVPREQLDDWAGDYLNRRPPGGESLHDLQKRLQLFLDEIPAGPVVIFTHGGVIRALTTLTGMSPESAMAIPVPLTSAFLRSPGGLQRLA